MNDVGIPLPYSLFYYVCDVYDRSPCDECSYAFCSSPVGEKKL